jgi:predicted Zn-dependent protease
LTAVATAMAFSRGQESEADLLGAGFMADAGFDPHAATRVWQGILAEDNKAATKRKKPNLFSKTHPSSAKRVTELNDFANANYPDAVPDPVGRERHVQILDRHYMMLMEDQLDTNRFGRTQAILERHDEIGVRQQLVDYFHGEMFRQRDEEGDVDFAKEAYRRATLGERPMAEAYHNLGYLFLKEKNMEAARYNFRRYLELEPDADDRAMIEYYLEES